MKSLIEKVDIQNLKKRADDLHKWIYDNPLEDIRTFEDKANQLAILSVRIHIYNKNNTSK
jgi:hypothetical protein|nr:MAG TPA: MCM N-terminal domain [Crassvirales sp.]